MPKPALVCAVALLLGGAAACAKVEVLGERVSERFRPEESPPAVSPAEPSPTAVDVSGTAVWDGQPSLGGVWVAHPDVAAPERVRIARADSDAAIEGWLFRRGSPVEGPELQVSSEAAEALGLAPDEPVELTVERLAGVAEGAAE